MNTSQNPIHFQAAEVVGHIEDVTVLTNQSFVSDHVHSRADTGQPMAETAKRVDLNAHVLENEDLDIDVATTFETVRTVKSEKEIIDDDLLVKSIQDYNQINGLK